jgi:hypothetical protein
MDNKVGDNVPSTQTVNQLLDQLIQIILALRAFCVTLSPDERRRQLRMRRGAEPHIARVHDLAAKYKVDIPGIPLQGMTNDLDLYTLLRPFEDNFRAGVTLAEHTAGQAESEAWEAFLAYYATLSGMAAHLPQLATELDPVTKFMAQRRPKPAAEPQPAPAAQPAAEPQPAAAK